MRREKQSCQRRLPRRLARRCVLGRTVEAADAERSSGLCRVSASDLPEITGAGMGSGNLGLWFRAKDGLQPKSGKTGPHPTIRTDCVIEKADVVIQYRNSPAGRKPP